MFNTIQVSMKPPQPFQPRKWYESIWIMYSFFQAATNQPRFFHQGPPKFHVTVVVEVALDVAVAALAAAKC